MPKDPNGEELFNIPFRDDRIYIPNFPFTTTKKNGTKAKELLDKFKNLEKRDQYSFHGTKKNRAVQQTAQVKTVFPTLTQAKEYLLQHTLKKQMRDYQQQMFYCGVANDSVVNLPTGSGKTLLAFYLMSLFREYNPKKSILFLTPIVELTKQQFNSLKEELQENNSIENRVS